MACEPGVLYYCPCAGSMTISEACEASDEAKQTQQPAEGGQDGRVPVAPNSPALVLRASPIEDLYYCDDCSEIRCARCVIEEPAGYHCPNCLFDVPTASVRSEKNCCARNCFQCPVCTHTLSVVEGEDGSGGGKPFSLACSVCFWDSRIIGWAFEKATGISGQIEKMRANEDAVKEYGNLLGHWRAVQRVSMAAGASSTSAIGTAGLGSLKHRLTTTAAGISGTSQANAVPAYQPVSYVSTDHTQVSDLMATTDADTVSFNGGMDAMEPKRVRLHMKIARRCRKCHHILIKPESKAQATRFKIQLVAAHFLPTITLPTGLSPRLPLPRPPFRAGTTVPVLLRLSNPLYTEMQVTLSCHAQASDADVEVLASKFALAPFTELWEYDDDDDNDDNNNGDNGVHAAGSGSSQQADGDDQRGIVDRHGNRVAVQLSITPKAPTENLTVPFHVTCTHVDDMDGDVEGDDTEQSAGRIVTNSFWVYISIGEIQ
ncbi:dynactin p62 [Martensiomyces pterosporus]|nr:dynactin p62 [Martensiomyces pterosporus]